METPTIPLVQGQATYALPNRTIAIGIAYLTVGYGTAAPYDTPMGPISATDWGAISNKSTQGSPNTVFLNLQPVPTITVWPVPDAGSYVLNVQSFRQMQDVALQGGQTLDAPYRFLDAFTAGLAARMARIYAPALYQMRKQDWEEAWNEAAMRDTQDVAMYITPGLAGYFR